MRRRTIILLLLLLVHLSIISFGQPTQFTSTGIGGGGALFSPSINPSNPEEFYVGCDLGALYHTVNDGQLYSNVPFTEAVIDIFGKVVFTSDPDIRYLLKWDEASYATRPARSDDGGKTWVYVSGDIEKDENKLFIYADYQHPDRVVWSTYGTMFFSRDGGEHSTRIYEAKTGAGILLSGVYFDGDTILFGTNDGVLVSVDGGVTVKSANFAGIPADERIIGFGAGKDESMTRYFALTGGENDVWAGNMGPEYWGLIRGVYTMTQASGQWVKSMNGIDKSKHFAAYLGMAQNDPNTCYLAGATPEPYTKPLVMKTSDGGMTWKEVFLTDNNQNIYTGYQGYKGDFDYWWGEFAEGFTVNPLHSEQAIITDLGFIHETRDGGATWHQKYLSAADENPAGHATPKKKAYHGVGLQQTSVWQIYWFDPSILFGCFTDIRGVRSTDGGESWSMDYTGHTLNTLYRITKHNKSDLWFGASSSIHDMYETTFITNKRLGRSGRSGKVLFSSDKGKTWKTMRDFGTPVVWVTTSPVESEVLYASVVSPDGKGGIWKASGISDPANAIWEKLAAPQGANIGRPHNIRVLDDGTLVVSWGPYKDDDRSVFHDGSGVFVSDNGGATWKDVSLPEMKYWTQDVVIDPNDPGQNTWYACVWSGWGGPANDKGRLWRTTDRGKSWTPMTESVQFHRVYSVTVDPRDAETMYLTTETEGLWVTHNKSAANPTWTLVQSYPYHAPRRVFFNPYNQKQMWVASFGNGMMYGETVTKVSHSRAQPMVKIYPNLIRGLTGAVFVSTDYRKEIGYEMADLEGNIIHSGVTANGQIPVDLPAPGVYLLSLKIGQETATKRVVVLE